MSSHASAVPISSKRMIGHSIVVTDGQLRCEEAQDQMADECDLVLDGQLFGFFVQNLAIDVPLQLHSSFIDLIPSFPINRCFTLRQLLGRGLRLIHKLLNLSVPLIVSIIDVFVIRKCFANDNQNGIYSSGLH
jgi:hypothetical protein